jgi:2-(1,2-epoxy-1,2-dihydrophenyl)acetyl-CoA isomerase
MSNNEPIETGTDHLLAAQEAAVLTLTLNRPEVRNALSAPMLDGLSRMLEYAETSPDVRVVVLTGAGAAFCAGGDLTVLSRGESMFGPADEPHSRLANQILVQRATVVRLHRLRKPTVAVVPGPAVGAGLGLALACDLRYGGPAATLRTGFVRLGLAGDFGCTWLLRQIVGPSRALELLYLAEAVPAQRAQQLGLLTDVVADADLPAHVRQIASQLAVGSSQAFAAMKDHVTRAGDADLATCADAEAQSHVHLLNTDAHRSAVAALHR